VKDGSPARSTYLGSSTHGLSVLSHELKAPLNAIEGYLNIMKEKQAGNDIASYESMIDRALERVEGMRNLTMDLLDFTKIRLVNRKDKIKMVNLHKTAKMSVSTVKPYAIQKNISIKLETDERVEFEADPYDMEIIFNNLLSNAVKYNRDNGTVTIAVSKQDEGIVITVADNGIGMSEEEISQLFKEFVRIRNDKTKNITGSGLGLSIVRKITDIYHGKISVTSKPDEGTVFKIVLPV
jgi:signal transduction histidine kinase